MSATYERIMVLDAETRWAKQNYTLSNMTTEEYIRDKRFKAFGFGYKFVGDKGPARWVTHKQLPEFFAGIDWSTTAVCCHNAMFDAAILSWHYGCHPAFIFDTLSMARALYGVEVGNSAAKLAIRFDLPPKGTATTSTDGLDELSEVIERELAEYCQHDVFLCEQFLLRMMPGYPTKELRLIDMTIKMFTEPKLVLDQPLLEKALREESAKRNGLLKRLGASDKDLGNNDKMACFVAELGFKPPTKKSPSNPQNTIWAFAKKDAGFQQLLNSDNEELVALCEARLMVKSSGDRTRAQRFVDIAQRGALPVPLKYYAAGPGRWGGDGAINLQSLRRGGAIRDAIMAPAGYQIVVGDLRQIEPRVLAVLTDYERLLNIFRSDEDAYSLFGRESFNDPTISKETHPDIRQAAKSQMLGCGYGIGWQNFAGQQMVGFLGGPPTLYTKDVAKKLGVTNEDVERFLNWDVNLQKMSEIPRTCTNEELLIHCLAAKAIIDRYRATATPVVKFWELCDKLIGSSLFEGEEFEYKCLVFSKEKILLPNGMSLKYPGLRKTKDELGKTQWVYGEHGTKIYGSKVVENITQGVARIVMSDGMLRTQKRYFCAMTCHDEASSLVPDGEVEEAKVWIHKQMCVEPKYLPGIPLDAEVGAHRRYGKAKI